jgi:uncharacterized membrane protein YdbT with pleckstrin-like domain
MHYRTWNKVLGVGEKVEWEFSLSSRYLNFNIFFWTVIALTVLMFGFYHIAFFIAGIWVFLGGYFYFGLYLRWANSFAFTNKRILIHRGWLSTSMVSVDYSKITDLEVRQSFVERLVYNSGILFVNTAGSTGQEIILSKVGEPYLLKKKLAELMEKDEQTSRTSSLI